MDYLYYPGCALKKTAIDYDESFQAIAGALGIRFTEMGERACCGATVARSVSSELAGRLPLVALGQAAKQKLDLLTLCPSCHLNHRQAAIRQRDEAATADPASAPEGGVRVTQLLEVLAVDLGLAAIRERIVRPLAGIRTVPYYGCLVARPFPPGEHESRENPHALEKLIETAGASAVDFPYKVDCCGGGILLSKEKTALKLAATILREAANHSPDCIVVACPLCHFMLDAKQRVVERELKTKLGVPVLYITQLLGLAMGIEPRKLGLQRLLTSPDHLLRKLAPAA